MAVTLSSASSWAAPQPRVNAAAGFSAIVCSTSAGVHAALVAPHAGDSHRLAFGFVIATIGLAAVAVLQVVTPTPAASAAAAGVLLAVAGAYVLSRTEGLPALTVHQEPFDPLGLTVTFLEVTAALVSARPLFRRSSS